MEEVLEERGYDSLSRRPWHSRVRAKLFKPLRDSWNKQIAKRQMETNEIGLSDRDEQSTLRDFFKGCCSKYKREQLVSRARTVESPALSVDSGGRSSGGGVASEIAKILNVKQGHYADLYDRIDRPNMSTRRPADALEDAMRSAVQRLFVSQERENKGSSG